MIRYGLESLFIGRKSPHHPYADLGVMEGMVSGIYDLALVPKDTQILSLTMPLKSII